MASPTFGQKIRLKTAKTLDKYARKLPKFMKKTRKKLCLKALKIKVKVVKEQKSSGGSS